MQLQVPLVEGIIEPVNIKSESSSCNLELILKLASDESKTIAWNVEANRPLYSDELEAINHITTTIYSPEQKVRIEKFRKRIHSALAINGIKSIDECPQFSVSSLSCGPEESENTAALFGFQRFYQERGLKFDMGEFWCDESDYKLWNVCDYPA